ncbi:MAG TPA: CesT family type III secretion system chaperone [Kofleriaceae bacterium]
MVALSELLAASGLADKAVRVDDNLVRFQWGSAFVIAGISGSAVVAIAPLFRAMPTGKEAAFYRKLLEHNGHMGGMASFAIQPDGWVVLHAGRALKGMDGHELATMVAAVGKFADQFDDQLIAEFYGSQPEATNRVMSELAADVSGANLPQTD